MKEEYLVKKYKRIATLYTVYELNIHPADYGEIDGHMIKLCQANKRIIKETLYEKGYINTYDLFDK
jgi:hypothetical protein